MKKIDIKQIKIPVPCTEDWNKMTPTEKGVFCDKCAFEVIDFTSMSPEEIKMTLSKRIGERTCGHIAPVQMEMVNTNYHSWENQTVPQFRSKFLYACMMVFGMTLFTSCVPQKSDPSGYLDFTGGDDPEMIIDGEMDISGDTTFCEPPLNDDYPILGMVEEACDHGTCEAACEEGYCEESACEEGACDEGDGLHEF